MTNIAQQFGMPLKWNKVLTPGFLCGIEYEIEDIKDYNEPGCHQNGITVEKDGSLRNNGREFITQPFSIDEQKLVNEYLQKTVLLGKAPFTHRTSTHVHVNVCTLTLDQLHTFTMLYAALEPMFFDYAGGERKNSIFCVPLNYTYLPSVYNKGIHWLMTAEKGWHKYTAFNLKRTKEIGTVEFRHLFGTLDWNIIGPWLKLIRKLYNFVETTPEFSLKEYLLNGNTSIDLLNKVFGIRHQYTEQDFYHNILDVKLSYVKN